MNENFSFNLQRRRLFQFASGLAIGSLGGCSSLRLHPSNAIHSEPPSGASITPILRPLRIGAEGKPTRYCLDTHAHFFNASDVNIEGYLEGPVAHSIKSPLLRKFVEHMSPLVDDLAGTAPYACTEFKYLEDQMLSLRLAASSTGTNPLDELGSELNRNLAKTLFEEMTRRGLDDEFIALGKEHARLRGFPGDTKALNDFSEETVLQAIDPLQRRERHRQLYGKSDAKSQPNTEAGGVLEFVAHMLSFRWMALRTYQICYSENTDAFGIDGVFGALVDFDYFLDGPPRSSREDQVKLHSLLSKMSGGYMLPLVGYNPWTDIKREDESLLLVKKAVKEYGFVGVKIYPPIGYFPYGNSELGMPSKKPRPDDLRELDKKLEALFCWCADYGVPVMAHTGESMGRDDPSDEFAKPEGWTKLLARFSGKTPPVINAGHFGGDNSKDEHHPKNWPRRFAEIAKEPPGANFYGDLGYWSALEECDSNSDCDTAIQRLTEALKANPDMVNRIMFGTDWFMLSKEPDWISYPKHLAANLAKFLPADKLFYQNAIKCFGLGTGDAQRERVLTPLQGIRGGIPAWLQNA